MNPIQVAERERLERLFSIVFTIDRGLRITHASEVLSKYVPAVTRQPLLTTLFDVVRPGRVDGFEDLANRESSLVLLRAADGSFAVRGQVATLGQGDEQALVFCGSPWLYWLNSEQPDLKLGMEDFAPQDAQLDQLFFMNTERAMVADLESLAEELQAAKDQLETSQRARDEFFTRMSHEMRTPLNGVVSGVSLLEDCALTPEARELTGLVKGASRNLMHVINYVLDISKIESEDEEGREVPFEFDDLFRSVFDIVRPRAQEKGIALVSRVDASLSPTFLGDWNRLRQILLNLVNNAVKFTSSGEVRIEVAPAAGHEVEVRVRDTGVGMSPEVQERIFDPFFSLEAPGGSAQDTGTGLGLDIVQRSVQALGGQIHVTSHPGEGSEFRLVLPIRAIGPEEEDAQLARERPSSGTTPALRGRVLLVDDNTTNLMLGRLQLERMGIDVLEALNGEDALKLVEAQGADLVLMDIDMPGMDGFETTRRIRQRVDDGTLPILALTAYASNREQDKSRAAGMNGYLTKPVSQAQLAEALAPWLERPADPPTDQDVVQEHVEGEPDWAALRALAEEIGPANVALVIATFGQEAQGRWESLRGATAPGEQAGHAHFLVSTCRSFGLAGVAAGLADVERSARSDRRVEKARLDALHGQFRDAYEAVRRWADGLA